MTSVLFLPGFAYFVLVKEHKKWFKIKWNKEILKVKTIVICLLLFFIGLLPYAYLPIRSSMDPALDWGNPETLPNFIEHISGKQYKPLMFSILENELFKSKLLFTFKILTENYSLKSIFFLLFSLLGVIFLIRGKKEIFLTLTAIYVFCSLYSISYKIPDIDAYYIPNMLVLFIFASCGLFYFIKTIETIKTRLSFKLNKKFLSLIFVLFLIFPLVYGINNFKENNKNNYYLAHDFANNVLNNIENDSLFIFELYEGDFSSPFRYSIGIEKTKSIKTVIINLLGVDWYKEKIEQEFDLKKTTWPQGIGRPDMPSHIRKEIDRKLQKIRKELIDKNIEKRPVYFFTQSYPKISGYSFFDQGLVFRAIEKNKKNQEDYLNQSFNLIIGEKSKDHFSKAVFKRYANIFYRKGVRALNKTNYSEAIDHFIKTIQIDNYFFEAHYNLAVAHHYQGNYSQALIYLKNAYVLNPTDEDIQNLLLDIKKESVK